MFPTWAPHQVLWAIPAHPATRHLAMYGDGNLVLGDDQWRAVPKQDGTPMFVTGAFGAGSFATVTDDGNLFVQSADGVGRWRHH